MRCRWLIATRNDSKRWTWVAAGISVILNVTLLLSSSQAQVGVKIDAKLPFRENVTLPVDSNLLKRFGTIKALLEDRRWAEAIVVLQEIAQTESKSLVLVQPGKAGDVATYLNVATRCNVLLSSIPAEGRADYRQKVDPQARRWYENWQRTRDEAELLRIVRQTFLSSYADEALLALGEAAWDRGDFASAQSSWEQLVPLSDAVNPADYPTVLRYPDTNLDQAAILARITLCSIMRRETDRAEDELLQFAERYPAAEGQIAGERGPYVEILRKTLVESRNWKAVYSSAEVATFGLSFERYRRIPENVDVGALRWEHSLTLNPLPHQPGRLPFQNDYLSFHPVVYDNRHEKIVLVNDTDAIRAWNILTGEPAWKSVNPDPTVIYPPFPDAPAMISEKSSIGVPHYTMTIADDRLYARMGSPVTCASNVEARREQPSDLVCLDLKQEGKLIWKVAAQELFSGAPTWRYEGTPVVFGGRAYVVVCRRHPQLELMIVCLDADDGRIVWQRPLGAFRASVDDNINRISHLLLTAGGNRLFLSTDLGAIVALDALDGRLEWALSYESRIDDPLLAPGESSRISLTPAMYHDGLLFVAPSDANSAYCVEAESGRILWRYPYVRNGRREVEIRLLRERQWKHLLGVVPGGKAGRLIVSGNSVWAIDIETGTLAWSPGDGALKRGTKGPFGRGLIVGSQVLIPLRESIEFFDLQSGELTRTVPLKTPEVSQQGGNLTLAGGILLVAQPNRLAAFGEYSQLKERIEEDLTNRPDDTAIRIRLAELEVSAGQREEAIAHYRELLKRLDPADPSFLVARQKLSKQLLEFANTAFGKGAEEQALEMWREAFSMTDDVAIRVELIFKIAQANELLDNPSSAVGELQQILSNEQMSQWSYEKSTAGIYANQAISRLIAERGRKIYQDVETDAVAKFEVLKQKADRSGLHRLIVRYPHAEVALNARQVLVGLHREAGEIPEAFAVLDEIRRQAADERSLVETTLSMLDLFRQAGYTNSMSPLWRSLANVKVDTPVEYAGAKRNLSQLVAAQLQELEPKAGAQPRHVERDWLNEFSANGRVIIPSGIPASPPLKSVLICFPSESSPESWQWRCIDWQTGRVRWEVSAAEPINVVQWTPVHLLFGTIHGWQARTAENGRMIWEQRLPTQVVPRLFGTHSGRTSEESVWPSVFDIERGLQIFDPIDGTQVAKLRPPGKLSSIVGFGDLAISADQIGSTSKSSQNRVEQQDADHPPDGLINLSTVVIQTLKPVQNWIATATSPRNEWHLEEFAEGSELSRTRPFIHDSRLIGLTYDNILCGYPLETLHRGTHDSTEAEMTDMEQLANHWSYRNFATAHAVPVIVSSAKDLLIVVDGTQLASFDPLTGSRKWFAGLTSLPMRHPAEQISFDHKSVFATGQGILRAVSIQEGSILFERYLGSVEQQWKTLVAWEAPSDRMVAQKKNLYETSPPASIVAAWSVTPTNDHRYTLSLCDGQSGTLLQQFRVENAPQGISIDSTGRGILWTDRSVIGVRFSSANLAAEIGKSIRD